MNGWFWPSPAVRAFRGKMTAPDPLQPFAARRVFSVIHVTKAVFVALLSAFACVSIAQESAQVETPHLVEYDQSPDLPNGVAFYMTLFMLDSLHADTGGTDSAALVAQELELSHVDSQNFVSRAQTTLYFINTDVETQIASHLCRFAGVAVSRHEKYIALQQTYDIQKAIYDHHYDQFRASLDAATGERLQQWIDETKLVTRHYEIDFEEADKMTGRDSTETLSVSCERGK